MSSVVPEGWRVETFGNLTTLIKSGLSRRLSLQDIGIPVINSGNLTSRGLDTRELKYWYLDDPQGAKTGNYILLEGDILLNFINSVSQIGKSCIFRSFGRPCIYTTNIFCIRVREESLSDFVHHLMLGDSFQKEIGLITKPAVNQASFTKDELSNIRISVPPLPEQKKIASILTSVDEVIENTQKQIDKLQDLKKATMNELLTKGIGHTEFKDSELGRIPMSWEVRTIGELGNIITGSTPSTTNRELYDGDYMFVSPADISEGMFVSKTGKKLSLAGLKKSRQIPNKSIMVVCIGSTIGKVALTTQECASNQQINSIVPKEDDPYFIYFAMKWMAHIIKKEAGTQAVPLLNKTDFSNLIIPVPPTDEQQKIGLALHSINIGTEGLESKLSQTQSLKKSLMQDLLTGKVRVTVN